MQLNLNARRATWLPVPSVVDQRIEEIGKPVIIQDNSANHSLNRSIVARNHQVLFDSSGGLGRQTVEWPSIISGKACGFAGGLGPDTIAEDIVRIEHASQDAEVWIDMETHLRTDDRFDLGKATIVLNAVLAIIEERRNVA